MVGVKGACVCDSTLSHANEPKANEAKRNGKEAVGEMDKNIEAGLTDANTVLRFVVFTVKGDSRDLDNCNITNPQLLMLDMLDENVNESVAAYSVNITNFSKDLNTIIQQKNPEIITAFVSYPAYLREGISAGVELWNSTNLGIRLRQFSDLGYPYFGEKPECAFIDFIEVGEAFEIHISIHSKNKQVATKWLVIDGDLESASESIMEILYDAGVTDIHLPSDSQTAIKSSQKAMRLH
jgi:hypothetical protein